MQLSKDICAICAYRGTCQKKFSLPAGRHCPEFERDYMIKGEEEPAETKMGGKSKGLTPSEGC